MKIFSGLERIKSSIGKKPSSPVTKPTGIDSREPYGEFSHELSQTILANAAYESPQNQVKTFKSIIKQHGIKLPDDFYEKFDYDNIGAHLNHLKFMVYHNSDYGYGNDVFKNGYFYSKDGANALDILIKNYSTKKLNGCRDAFSIMLEYTPEQILKADERGLFNNELKTLDDEDFDKIEDLIELSDDEYKTLQESGLIEKGIHYASKNSDINQMFINLAQDEQTFWAQSNYKKLDTIISALNDDNKIKEVAKNISKLEHKDVLEDIINREDSNNIDIETISGNLDDLYDSIHSHIKDFDDDDFYCPIRRIIGAINKDNCETIKKLVVLKGIDQHLLYSVQSYIYNRENAKKVDSIIDEINNGNESLAALPIFKYAKVNSRVKEAKGEVLLEYDETTPLSKLEEESKLGDIFGYGNSVYIKGENKLEKLDIDKKTYKKLFPKYESLCVQQGDTADCYFLTSGLISLWKNPKGRINLLKMFKQEDNDVVVTIPGFSKYPIRFKDGNIELLKKHSTSSLGNLMLEQAYAKAKYAAKNGITGDASKVDPDVAMEYIGNGFESETMNELTGTKDAIEYIEEDYKNVSEKPDRYEYVKKEKMSEIFDKFSDLNKYIICLSSGTRDGGYLPEYGITPKHSYAIEKIDTENKTITIVNPYNSLYASTITYDQAKEKFSGISVIEI